MLSFHGQTTVRCFVVSDHGHSEVDRGQAVVDHGQPSNHGQQESRVTTMLPSIQQITGVKLWNTSIFKLHAYKIASSLKQHNKIWCQAVIIPSEHNLVRVSEGRLLSVAPQNAGPTTQVIVRSTTKLHRLHKCRGNGRRTVPWAGDQWCN